MRSFDVFMKILFVKLSFGAIPYPNYIFELIICDIC